MSKPYNPLDNQKKQAIVRARNFVHKNGYGTLNTINQGDHEYSAFPVGQVEYYSDTSDEDCSLLMIRVDMSSAFRNINLGSTASFSIRTGDAPKAESPIELASQQRIILYGEFEECNPTIPEMGRFFQIHPDALEWAPNLPGFHKTYWTKFYIKGIYYIGGFGGENYIGKLPLDAYQKAPVEEDEKFRIADDPPSFISWILSWFGARL